MTNGTRLVNPTPEQAQFANDLRQFIELGAVIINTEAGPRYGYAYSGVVLQPGFMPVATYPKICFIGITPSSNRNDAIDAIGERDRYVRWGAEATEEAYQSAYDLWLQNFRRWHVSANARKFLEISGVDITELAWLNLCKVQDSGSIDARLATLDFPWLKKQLSLLGPTVFVVLGSNAQAYDFFRRRLQDLFPERFGVRGQRGSGESVQAIAARYSEWRESLAAADPNPF